ncbi:MAG TPA: glycine cleavage T C-terminal barrel domain-containing protein [Candidatus Eisenbacteria bacterium]|nr:glycine cleavage T C-terminal barrel domain-containing protein [Candidatus Eisenbacteria bacterium]
MAAFDMGLVQRGARNRRTPYYEATQRYGPQGFTVYNHMYFPIRFDTFEAEFDALLNAVTIWDVSVERCLEISGPDGARFAQLLTPRDLSKCAVGQAKYVLICDSDGGIVNDPVLTRMDENTFWFALASSDALLFARGLRNAYPDLDVTIHEADVAPLQVQGPRSKELLRDLVGDSISDLKYYWWRRAEIRGIPVVVTRTGWTSEVGYEIYLLDTTRGSELWETLMEVGAPYGVKPTGPSDIRRIEGGIFNWGADMTYENNPFEMGLDRLVDTGLADDASISIAALRRIQDAGVDRRIVGVELDGAPFPALNNVKWPAFRTGSGGAAGAAGEPGPGAERDAEGESVGKVTSAIWSPRLRRNIGYCWVPVDLAAEGTALRVETEWGSRTATVVPMPFVDPEKRIPVS